MELQEKQREARRRNILENSRNRLAKISGNKNDGMFIYYMCLPNNILKYFLLDPIAPPKCNIIYPDPELELEDPIRNNFADTSIFNMLNRQNATNHLDESLDSNGLNSFMATLNNTSQQPSLSKFEKFLQSKIHISLLVIFTYGLIVMETPWPTDNVFLLFLVWELAEIFLLRTYEVKQTSILTILLLLAGMPTQSTVILKWFELVNKILRDVAIFVFFFVCVHIFWELWVVGRTLHIILDTQSIHI